LITGQPDATASVPNVLLALAARLFTYLFKNAWEYHCLSKTKTPFYNENVLQNQCSRYLPAERHAEVWIPSLFYIEMKRRTKTRH
jgi:hypothetical protein